MKLTERDEFGYRDEVTVTGKTARIFCYRVVLDQSVWSLPGALECRGTTFEMEGDKPIRIMCRPLPKFFNLGETKETKTITDDQIELVMEKLDGSLVSSYVDNGIARLKTRNSLYSDVANDANGLLYQAEYEPLRRYIEELPGYTFNFEYTAPTNRIVLKYDQPKLTLLQVRNNETGDIIPRSVLFNNQITRPHLVNVLVGGARAFSDIVDVIRNAEDLEGIVCLTKSGTMVKVKSDWYVGVHKLKDNSLSPNNLIYYVAESETDDLRAAYDGDDEAIARIELFESAFRHILGMAFNAISDFVDDNAGLDRRQYAEKATIYSRSSQYNDFIFDVLMICFGGVDYDRVIEFMKTHYIRNYKKYIPKDKIAW